MIRHLSTVIEEHCRDKFIACQYQHRLVLVINDLTLDARINCSFKNIKKLSWYLLDLTISVYDRPEVAPHLEQQLIVCNESDHLNRAEALHTNKTEAAAVGLQFCNESVLCELLFVLHFA